MVEEEVERSASKAQGERKKWRLIIRRVLGPDVRTKKGEEGDKKERAIEGGSKETQPTAWGRLFCTELLPFLGREEEEGQEEGSAQLVPPPFFGQCPFGVVPQIEMFRALLLTSSLSDSPFPPLVFR